MDGVIEPAVMVRVRQMCAHLTSPHWMPDPASWVWRRPDGNYQGFGTIARDQPGLANLLWLTLDMHRAPWEYDASLNTLWGMVINYGATSKLRVHPLLDEAGVLLPSQPLLDVAGILPLREFHAQMERHPPGRGTPLECAYPLIELLARRRMQHADA